MTVSPHARKQADARQPMLARVESPEQLDRLMTVTSARSWIALVAVAGMVAAMLVWSVVGTLPSYVQGRGLFMRKGGSLASAVAPSGGTLEKILVRKGDHVEPNQLIAEIAAPDPEQQIASTRSLVTERQAELDRQQRLATGEIDTKRKAVNKREAMLREAEKTARNRVEVLKQNLKDQQQLLEHGIVTRSAVQQVQLQYDEALREAADIADQINQAELQLQDQIMQAEQRVKNAEFDLFEAQRQMNRRIETYRANSEVRAQMAGTVEEIQLRAGYVVAPGQSIVTIETSGEGLGFVLFAPLRDGEKIQTGQTVRITPNWTIREEEGTMLGTVVDTARLPSTPEGLRLLLHNEDLVRHFSSDGPVFIVRIRLKRDPSTASGFAWTSKKGAGVAVDSGSFGTAEVLVKSQRPISLAIPAIRRWIGI